MFLKSDLIVEYLKTHTEWSSRRIATAIDVNNGRVLRMRRKLEAQGEIPRLEMLINSVGDRRSSTCDSPLPRELRKKPRPPMVPYREFGNMAPKPPTDSQLLAGIERLTDKLSTPGLRKYFNAALANMVELGVLKVKRLGPYSVQLDETKTMAHEPAKGELNHQQFPQQGERRYAPQ